jgi:signal transduction histidine kinase
MVVFYPLRKAAGHGQNGFAGIQLKSEFVKQQFLPEVIAASLNISSALLVSVFDRDDNEIYRSSGNGEPHHEVRQAFTPVFRQWKLGIGYADTTIDTLARRQFRQNLMFTGLALLLVLGGVALTLRATTREMKLAEAKSVFVSNVSHELKTPLALIRLFAEMLETGMVKHADKTQEYGRIINHESRRLTQLINNILDFSRIEAGRREYQLVETNPAVVVAEVLQSYAYQMNSAGFVVQTNLASNLPNVRLDRDAIAQAVLNLLNNAVKYSPDEKRIEVCVEARAERLAIAVRDHGIGIARAEQRRIFEKFYRVGSGLVHDTKGSGLGLSIVQHIVAAHRGQVTVESTPGQGSCFTIWLPIEQADETTPRLVQPFAQNIGDHSVVENPHH